MKLGTIYKITSPSNKIYIGQTSNFKRRMKKYQSFHLSTSRVIKQPKLYNSILKHGFESHNIEIIEDNISIELNRDLLDEREIYWISFFDSYKNGLNCNTGGSSCKGMSPEGRERLRLSKLGNKNMLGKIMSEETKKKISNAQKGRKLSEEHLEKIRKYRPSEETRKKYSDAKKGRKLSEETKRKIGEAGKGKTRTEEQKERLREVCNTPEYKQKMSESLKKTFALKRINKIN